MITGHGGNIYHIAGKQCCSPSELIDMSSNINPLGPMPGLLDYLKKSINDIKVLPDPDASTIIKAFAAAFELDADCILAGNGTTQFIYSLPLALRIEKALVIGPTYSDYADTLRIHNCSFDYYFLKEKQYFKPDFFNLDRKIKGYDTVFICNPNNPTGTLFPTTELLQLCHSHPDTRFIIDESYFSFVKTTDRRQSMMHQALENVFVLYSMSKIFRIPGLRVGFLIASQDHTKRMKLFCQPWSVNSLAQASANYLLSHMKKTREFIKKSQDFLEAERTMLYNKFHASRSLLPFPSETSFILVKLQEHYTAEEIFNFMLREKILIRNCSNFIGLSNQFFRVSLKENKLNIRFADILLSRVNR